MNDTLIAKTFTLSKESEGKTFRKIISCKISLCLGSKSRGYSIIYLKTFFYSICICYFPMTWKIGEHGGLTDIYHNH